MCENYGHSWLNDLFILRVYSTIAWQERWNLVPLSGVSETGDSIVDVAVMTGSVYIATDCHVAFYIYRNKHVAVSFDPKQETNNLELQILYFLQ